MTETTTPDLHWLFEILQTIDVGLVVFDRSYHIQTWNAFMENHSGRRQATVKGRDLFEVFPELPEAWFRHKVETVLQLNIRAFTTWEQRPWLVAFRNYHPITSTVEHMYQNSMLYPLSNARGETDHVALVLFDVTDVAINKLALEEANRELERLSQTDGLTGLASRQHWDGLLSAEIRRSRRHRHCASLLLFDLDHFKQVNDDYGHTVGDDVLRKTGQIVQETIRTTDLAGRYGGEEFAILLPETGETEALVIAERLRVAIQDHEFSTEAGTLKVTISNGIAELQDSMDGEEDWIDAADQALYASKDNGRNRSTGASELK